MQIQYVLTVVVLLLALMDREILQDAGKVSAELAKAHAESEFEKYRIVQERLYESDFDRFLALEDRVGHIDHK